jgi:hypothetical protein
MSYVGTMLTWETPFNIALIFELIIMFLGCLIVVSREIKGIIKIKTIEYAYMSLEKSIGELTKAMHKHGESLSTSILNRKREKKEREKRVENVRQKKIEKERQTQRKKWERDFERMPLVVPVWMAYKLRLKISLSPLYRPHGDVPLCYAWLKQYVKGL